jgi:hypothetical protein
MSFADSAGGTVLDSVIDADSPAALALTSGTVVLRGTGFSVGRQDVLANPRSFSPAQISGVTSAVMADAVAPLGAGLAVLTAPAVNGLGLTATGTFRFGPLLGMMGTY